jgi:hypothetical protein
MKFLITFIRCVKKTGSISVSSLSIILVNRVS